MKNTIRLVKWYRCQMLKRGHHRFRIALLMIVCLLFQQAAMAAYACPLERTVLKASTAQNCAGMGMEQPEDNPALCEKHCTPDRPVMTDHVSPVVPALALPPMMFDPMVAKSVTVLAAAAYVAVDRSDRPPRQRFCSLLI